MRLVIFPLNHKCKHQLIPLELFKKLIRDILEDHSILKIGQNIKYDYIVLKKLGIKMVNMDDTMLMSYVLKTGQRGHGLDELSSRFIIS